MWYAVKRLSLGLSLIVIAAAILLGSDWHRRGSGDKDRRARLIGRVFQNPFSGTAPNSWTRPPRKC